MCAISKPVNKKMTAGLQLKKTANYILNLASLSNYYSAHYPKGPRGGGELRAGGKERGWPAS